MSLRIYVPCDSAALSVGADAVAAAFAREARARNLDLEIVRNGSHGMLWLEPLVEFVTPQGRIGYGPVQPEDVGSLLDANGGPHPLRLGVVFELDWMRRQQRLTFARIGVTDPLSLDDYIAHGGLKGLKAALATTPAEVVEQVRLSGLRGRGGAGFPAGIKWKTVHDAAGPRKYVVCNADEGDSGTFADRMVFEGDPFMLIEGMAIAAYAVGASKGFIYLRSEYPHAAKAMDAAIRLAEHAGWIGADAFGLGKDFDLELRIGAEPIFAARKPRCSTASKASAPWCGPNRPCPPLPACSASRPLSTTS